MKKGIAIKLINSYKSKHVFRFILFLFFCTVKANAQIVEISLLDSSNHDPIPFAVLVNSSRQILGHSGLDGKIQLSTKPEGILTVKCTGYKNLSFTINNKSITLYLVPDTYFLGDIEIKSGINPAIRLIELAVKNRDINNPEKNCRFTYNAYNKLVFSANSDSLEKMSQTHQLNDTNFWKTKDFFDSQHLFLTESLTKKYHNPPSQSYEKIIANRVSGFENPVFSILATEFQSFGYYYDDIKLMGISYSNPISKNSYTRYIFRLTDTAFDEKDTLYTITFEPRTNKSFKALKGSLIIHTSTYALKSFKALPIQVEGFTIQINQLYEFIQNKQWFPVQLNARLSPPLTVSVNGLSLYGDNKGIITNIKIGDDITKEKTDEIDIEISSASKDSSIYRMSKFNNLFYDQKDAKTYKTVDSIGTVNKFDKKFNNIAQLFTGKIPIGPVSIDLNHLINFNHYEGYRLGLGLITNHKISKKHYLSGYGCYGFKDKAFKYGSELRVLFYPRKQSEIIFQYKNDITEAASPADFFEPHTFLDPQSYRQFYLRKFDHREIIQVITGTRFLKHFHIKPFANYQIRKYLFDYEYQIPINDYSTISYPNYKVQEIGAVLRIGINEKFILAENQLLSKGTKFPVIFLKYTSGLNLFEKSTYTYQRYDIKINKTFKIRKFGAFSIQANYGQINGNIPYSLLSSLNASLEKFALSVPNSFETMKMNEFLANQYAMLFLSHNFLSNLFYNTKMQPQLELFSSLGWGTLNHFTGEHKNLNFTVPDKGYFESGIRIHSLLKSKFSRFGIAFAYRYGPYANTDFKDNFVIKFTTGIVFD